MAGAWTMLVHQQERRKAMSSTHVARCGIRSETSMPERPCFLNLRVLARSGVSPLVNWLTGLPKLSGSGWPWRFCNSGFGSNRSIGLGPPTINMKITALALAGKCAGLAARGLADVWLVAAWPSRASSHDNASAPKPPPAWKRKSRRDWARGKCKRGSLGSLLMITNVTPKPGEYNWPRIDSSSHAHGHISLR